MKKYVFLFLATILVFSNLYAQDLMVATYNVRNENQGDEANGNGWKQRCPVITQLIRFNDFDVFGSQEVLYGQLQDMLQQLPEYDYIGVGRTDGKQQGEYSPIFFKKDKFSLEKSGTFWLSETESKPSVGWDAALPRICTWGKFKMKGSHKVFWFFNLHMDHIGVKARLESSKMVLERIRKFCGDEPVILTGDFNVDQTSDGYKLLSESGLLRDSYEVAQIRYALNGTFNDFDPTLKTDSRIDHVYVSKGFSVMRYGVLTDTYRVEADSKNAEVKSSNFPKEVSLQKYISCTPSDHFPVKVQLKFER